MKKYFVLCCLTISLFLNAQTNTDANRIVLNSVVLDPENKLPQETKIQLEHKLSQIATENGMGGTSINPRFVIAAKVNTSTKDIIAGPPQMVALNLEVIFYIGDAVENTLYSSTSLSLKGVGINENKAFINAIQNINIKNKLLTDFTNTGKNKIVEYYNNQCDFIIKKSSTLSNQQKYEEAIYELMQVPQVSKSCYEKCLSAVQPIYQKMIDRNGQLLLDEAKQSWFANQNTKGAADAGKKLTLIDPIASSYKEAIKLTESIRKKIEADEKRNWDFKMKKYNDEYNLTQQRIEAAKEVAITYYKNQPQTIIYNRIIWR